MNAAHKANKAKKKIEALKKIEAPASLQVRVQPSKPMTGKSSFVHQSWDQLSGRQSWGLNDLLDKNPPSRSRGDAKYADSPKLASTIRKLIKQKKHLFVWDDTTGSPVEVFPTNAKSSRGYILLIGDNRFKISLTRLEATDLITNAK